MKWRTDKPTADLIVADIAGSRYPEVLKLGSDCYYGTVSHLPVDYDSIERWADLEEDDNGIYITYKDISNLEEIMNYVHYEFRNGIGKDSFGKEVIEQFKNSYLEEDETVTDCHELEEEVKKYINDNWECEHSNENAPLYLYDFSNKDLLDAARHFAKWGAEHRDRFLNWIRDLIKKGIEKPKEALNILKRIDALINDDSLWGEYLKK